MIRIKTILYQAVIKYPYFIYMFTTKNWIFLEIFWNVYEFLEIFVLILIKGV